MNRSKFSEKEAFDELSKLKLFEVDCKYHIVWIPKYRKKVLYGHIREHLGDVILELARQRECPVLEGLICYDHVRMCIAIPPKHAVAQVVGYIKGKSAIHIARTFGRCFRNFTGEHFWARGYLPHPRSTSKKRRTSLIPAQLGR